MRRVGIIVTTIVSGALIATCTPEGAWDMISAAVSSPAYRGSMEITFDTSGLDTFLFDIPVPIRLTPDRITYEAAGEAGGELAVYDRRYEDGLAALDHEIAAWDPEGESVVWVRIPFVSPTEPVTLYLYAGTETAHVEPNPHGVWRNGYVAVLHFDDPDDPWKDSTAFGNHGRITNGKTTPSLVDGRLGRGFTPDDPTDAVSIPNSETTDTMAPFTWETWLYFPLPDPAGDTLPTRRIFSKGSRFLFVEDGVSEFEYQSRIGHTGTPPDDPNDDVFGEFDDIDRSINQWYRLSMRWTGLWVRRSLDLVRNGADELNDFISRPNTASESAVADPDSSYPLTIGNDAAPGAGGALPAVLDEVFISGVARSTDWIGFQVDAMTESNVTYGPFASQ